MTKSMWSESNPASTDNAGLDVLQPESQTLQSAGLGAAGQSSPSADSLQVTTPKDQVQQLLALAGPLEVDQIREEQD